MRLLDPGVGEITDRLTILSLKILFGEQAGKATTHFRAERTSLLAKIRSKDLNGVWFDKVLDLAAVNAALWHCEDAMRDWRNAPMLPAASLQSVADLAFRIQELNDQRAALVQGINKDVGESGGQEKL